MTKEQEYKIGANAYEFVQTHRKELSHVKQAELQAMLKDFAIEQVKNNVVLGDVSESVCDRCDPNGVVDGNIVRCKKCGKGLALIEQNEH